MLEFRATRELTTTDVGLLKGLFAEEKPYDEVANEVNVIQKLTKVFHPSNM
jgi:hypothetical protein